MGYARHIGRVGALALALGVGAAVASTPGIAYADPSDGTSASSSDSAPSSSTTDSTSSAKTAGTKASAPDRVSASKPADDASEDSTDEPDKDSTAESDNPVDAGTADKDAADADEGTVDEDAVDEELTPPVDEEPTPPQEEPHKDTVSGDSAVQPVKNRSDSASPATGAAVTAAADAITAADPITAPDETEQQSETVEPAAARDDAPAQTATDAITTVAATSVTPAPSVPARPRTLVHAVTEFVASVLQPLLSLGEGAPIQIPLLSAALSLVRNEFERVLGPRGVNVTAQQTTSAPANPAPQPPVSAAATQTHVLVIGIDGTNLSRILADDYNQNFFDLMGVSTTAASSIVGHTTISNPSWTAILTGVWGERTGVINNVFTPWTYNTWPTVFNQLESIDRAIQTMAVGNWDVINGIAGGGSIPADQNVFVGQLPGDKNWLATDDAVADLTVDAISGIGGPTPNFLFSYFVGVDENGHMYGGASEEYKLAIRNMDDNLGEILDAVAAREALGEDWTIMVVTDHGHQPQVGFGHGFQSPAETGTFVIAEGTDFGDGLINPRYEIVDITPTVVSLFGGTPRAGSDGVSLTTLGGSDVDPVDLKQALKDAIAQNGYPDIVTNVALGVRTVFATIPYYIFTFGDDIEAMVPDILAGPVSILFDGLYVITNIPAQVIAFLTGVSGASIFPLLPPAAPSFPPAQDATVPDAALMVSCGTSRSSAESLCGAAAVA